LYDSGAAEGFLFYVMPYVEGENLRIKLEREKQLSVEEAVELARAVAAALEHAHKQGVVHRDIKPENILLRDGDPLIADFGIALAVSHAGGSRLTETGLSIGTPHYMSPEQAMGDRELDARSDVYSLGAVLYEMLTGEPPYQGSTAQAIVARVITEEPRSITLQRRTVPPHVADAVHKALNKLPADRFGSAASFGEALVTPGFVAARPSTAAADASNARTRDWRLPAALAAAGVLAVVALLGWLRSEPSPAAPVAFRVEIAPDEAQRIAAAGGQLLTISPDGDRLVYVGTTELGGGTQLYQRRMGDLEIQPLPGTEGATHPFFSPDGEWIGFEQDDELRKVAVAGGRPLTVARVNPSRPHWGPNDTIIDFTIELGLFVVGGAGGIPRQIHLVDSTTLLRAPHLLPSGRTALATIWAGLEGAQIGLVHLGTGVVDTLVSEGTRPVYLPTGHILYGHASGGVFVVPFDADHGVVTGSPTPVLDNVQVFGGGPVQIEVSQTGTAVYLTGASGVSNDLVLVDHAGREEDLTLAAEDIDSPRFSPDGSRLALVVQDDASDVYVFDLTRETLSRLTFEGNNLYPLWSPDGHYVMFSSARDSTQRLGVLERNHDIYRTPADGSGPAELVYQAGASEYAQSWAADGTILYRSRQQEQHDLGVLLPGDSVGRPYLADSWDERHGAISPDGRWAAYTSNETGTREVYVRAFPNPAGRWQVSQGGGTEPVWAPDGRTVYYRRGDDLLAARVQAEPSFAVLGEEVLFTGRYDGNRFYADYDVHPDGDRFVMIREPNRTYGGMTVVVNWFDELRERLGGSQ
jgi:serine/threonine-protein kinase